MVYGSRQTNGMKMSELQKWKAPALRLIDAAERLIGEYGVEGVSLVQIAKAAGQANKYAVQYHFGSKEALLAAIFETRLERISARRRALMSTLAESGSISIRALLNAMIYPVYAEVSTDGLHHYARFASRVLDSGLAEKTWFQAESFASTVELQSQLRTLAAHLSPVDFELRVMLAMELLMRALTLIDRAASPLGDEQILDAALDMAARAFEPIPGPA